MSKLSLADVCNREFDRITSYALQLMKSLNGGGHNG
jgi:hypothetical protein